MYVCTYVCLYPVMCSAVAAKSRARSLQQMYPLHAKDYKLSTVRVLLFAGIFSGAEAAVQFVSLLFFQTIPVRNLCVLDTSHLGMLVYYCPFIIKVAWAL